MALGRGDVFIICDYCGRDATGRASRVLDCATQQWQDMCDECLNASVPDDYNQRKAGERE